MDGSAAALDESTAALDEGVAALNISSSSGRVLQLRVPQHWTGAAALYGCSRYGEMLVLWRGEKALDGS